MAEEKTPDYMSMIATVADAVYGQTSELGHEIMLAWRDFEKTAFAVQDDILAPSTMVREKIRNLIRLLYRVPNSGPKADCDQLRAKNAEYGGSWCKRGGRGAFHMLARKADRLDSQLKKHGSLETGLRAIEDSGEMLADTLGDLRRYLILCEAWHVAREQEQATAKMTTEKLGAQIMQNLNLCTRPGCGHAEASHVSKPQGNFFVRGKCLATNCDCDGFAEQQTLQAITGFDPTKTTI